MQIASMVTLGFILDLILGDPPTWPHPVKVIGHAIAHLTTWLNKQTYSALKRRWLGIVLWVIIVGGTGVITAVVMWASSLNHWLSFIIGTYICYACLSVRGLAIESHKIMRSLRANDLQQARHQVGMIVGRDTEQLGPEDVCKATIETVAENTSDGVVAPLIYLIIGGPVLGLMYKAVNTLDSMVGYRNEKYQDFGRFSAKADDVINYIPARITWLLLMASSMLLGYDYRTAFVVGKRDRKKHRSPNSGFSESVVAGALDLRLGGPHYYFGELVTKPFIGLATAKSATTTDIRLTLRLLYVASWMCLILCVGGRLMLWKGLTL
ncbi:adenosylcobinamide-phosphate synthase CbiB [Levilactobacillus yiduensis]|uniref:adenosylcobinamide-phosphate synthase CbiB n=1 Tax=Levilactobacillus yiduensis TaxID=2953880 RepID=UPI000EF2F47E|nr:adenosylcobinamide-phosphate synthase CbiB [Levilactobacillus yiduensis]AYM02452.1 cobalamin biosynthesis protein CobD [Levilactobacillus brevis]